MSFSDGKTKDSAVQYEIPFIYTIYNKLYRSTAVIIVNWNGWIDTIQCLDSLLLTISKNDQVIVCDNASTNDSMAHIKSWLHGIKSAINDGNSKYKKIHWIEYNRDEAEQGGRPEDPQLILINTGKNLGFAGANNIGLRYALLRSHQYFWLLNGDTVVNNSSLKCLRQRMQEDSSIGMCGSTLLYFYEADVVQALGGAKFDYSKGIGEHLGLGSKLTALPDRQSIEKSLDYVVGASMMVSRSFLERIGLMCEDYFLYFEEIDWAMRSKGLFKLAWAPSSLVLHKEGGSIGSSHRSRPSDVSLQFIYRSRLIFTKRHTPKYFLSVYRIVIFEAFVYLKRRDFKAVSIISLRLFKNLFKVTLKN
jgi:GT2 family glycosyltransferase